MEQGFEGTREEWLASLKGKSAYELAVEDGFEGSLEEWLLSVNPPKTEVNLGNLFDNSFDKVGYINPYDGVEARANGLKYTSKYYYFGAGTLFFYASKIPNSIVFIFYNTDKDYVGYKSFNGQTEGICGFGNDGYFRCYTEDSFDGQIYFSTNIPLKPIDYSFNLLKVEEQEATKRKLTIVNFGDSMFGNVQNSTSISANLQKISGNIVFNIGFGGTTLAKRTDRIGWDSFSLHSIVDAVCDDDFSLQDDTLGGDVWFPSYFFTTIETLKTINWENVDVITIALGTNDYYKDKDISIVGEGVTSYVGAFKYCVKRLRETYPHIRIIAITPILRFFDDGTTSDVKNPSGYGTLIDFKNALIQAAQEIRCPVLNAYDELGLSEENREVFFQQNDGCHLNERGRAMFASLINAKINEVCTDLYQYDKNYIYGE